MAFFTTKKTEKVFLAENAERCEKFRPFLYIQMFLAHDKRAEK